MVEVRLPACENLSGIVVFFFLPWQKLETQIQFVQTQTEFREFANVWENKCIGRKHMYIRAAALVWVVIKKELRAFARSSNQGRAAFAFSRAGSAG